jgi:RHS repeat-associated protein
MHFDYNGAGISRTYDWRYRYSAEGEREEKRLYFEQDSLHHAIGHNAWVYYLLGGSQNQLAVYHGQEDTAALCAGQVGTEVYFYPTEYLAYGVGGAANVVNLPGVGKEYHVNDYLGSLVESFNSATGTDFYQYDPWGKLVSATSPERKGWIDKERDRESGLGDFGARKYDATGEYPPFLSGDPWWEKYRNTSPYIYCFDNPICLSDPRGLGNGHPEPELETMPPEGGVGGGWGGGGGSVEPEAAAEGLAKETAEEIKVELRDLVEMRVTPTSEEAVETRQTGAVHDEMEQNSAKASNVIHIKSSQYEDVTRRGSVPNRRTDVSRAEFEKELESNGWQRKELEDEKVVSYEKDGARYVVRDDAKSTGGPTADHYSPGSRKADLKIRLKEK